MRETVSEFDATLRKLAITCQFGDTLQDTLCDQCVCGLRQELIQRWLLAEKGLTYTKVIEIARGMESVDKDAKNFRANETSTNKLDNQRCCYRCSRSNHFPVNSRFKEAQCHSCGKTGHIASICRSTRPARPPDKPGPQLQKHKTHVLEEQSASNDKLMGLQNSPVGETILRSYWRFH